MAESERRLAHTRSYRIDAFARPDGLWDLEARMTDVKARDIELHTGPLPAGEPLHDMRLHLTIDTTFNVVGVEVSTKAAPYIGECETFPQAYQSLVGLNLLSGFRAAVRERVGGTQGCTHLNELASILPTVAIQSMGAERFGDGRSAQSQPPHLGRCRALRTDGPVVARFYPRWARTQGKSE